MKTQIIQVEVHDDHISIRDKMNWSKTPRVLLVLPRKGKFALNTLDLKLLQRHATSLGAELGLITRSSKIIRAAEELGIPVFPTNLSAQRGVWPPQKGRRYRRRKKRRNLREWGETFRHTRTRWYTHPAMRLFFFSLATLALLAILFAFIPQAQVEIEPVRRVQSLIISVRANINVDEVFIAGSIPAYELRTDLMHQRSLATSGRVQIPVEVARGAVVFRNLTDLPTKIPAGTVIRSTEDEEIRFETMEDAEIEGVVDATVEVPVKSLLFGERGNLEANTLQAIEGELSLWLAVTNPAPTSGGKDEFVSAPTDRDREELRRLTMASFDEEFEEKIPKELAEGDVIFPDSLSEIEVLEEIYTPPEGETSDRLSLTMRVAFRLFYAKEGDLAELAQSALLASMPPGFTAVPNTLEFSPSSEFESNQAGITSWQMHVKQELYPNISSEEVSALTQGRSTEKAIQNLQENLTLASEPNITVTPSWWKWLPIAPFRIVVIVK